MRIKIPEFNLFLESFIERVKE